MSVVAFNNILATYYEEDQMALYRISYQRKNMAINLQHHRRITFVRIDRGGQRVYVPLLLLSALDGENVMDEFEVQKIMESFASADTGSFERTARPMWSIW